jgi:ribonuclease P protein component
VRKLRLGRLSERSEFETMLRLAPLVVTPHFALYFKKTQPSDLSDRSSGTSGLPLLTEQARSARQSVDNLPIRLGIVVPKRLSRRAVTRSLLKRQIRAAATRKLNDLEPGIWIVRQRTAFQTVTDGSAASERVKAEARLELDRLLEKVRRSRPGPAQ